MTTAEQRLDAFERLGRLLKNEIEDVTVAEKDALISFDNAKRSAMSKNAWFTAESIELMVSNISDMLESKQLRAFNKTYKLEGNQESKKIAVIMAGNIPLVGFHDFFTVLICGHRFLGKLSHEDPFLLPALAEVLSAVEPAFRELTQFTDSTIKDFDAVIATGSNNTARYFDYYFGKYPHQIRGNRNGVAILNGNESKAELEKLGLDIFSFFGLGCRNVSSLFVPVGYDFNPMFEAFEAFKTWANHSKYFNNYEYNKAIWLVNREPHFDNGFVLLKQEAAFSSPVAVLNYQHYSDAETLQHILEDNKEKIQCIVSQKSWWPGSYEFGKAQMPAIMDYADGVDTTAFLLSL